MIYFPLLAIFLWFGGYFMTARFMSTTGFTSDNLEKIISPPKWLYYLCGAPSIQRISKRNDESNCISGTNGWSFIGIIFGFIFYIKSYYL